MRHCPCTFKNVYGLNDRTAVLFNREILSLCNDGDVYCNITTFDWTQPHVRELWLETMCVFDSFSVGCIVE